MQTTYQALSFGGSTETLNAVTFQPPSVLSPPLIQGLNAEIVSDGVSGPTPRVPGPQGIMATGALHGTNVLDTLVSTGGPPLAALRVGMGVIANGIVPGTWVAQLLSPTSVQLSQPATETVASEGVIFVPQARLSGALASNGFLEIPGRGRLKLQPGDVIAVDASGWPILLSANTIAYGAQSGWAITAPV